MRKFYLIIFFCIGCVHTDHNKIAFTNATQYNNFINVRLKELAGDIEMVRLSKEHNFPLAKKMLDTLFLHSEISIGQLEMLSPYKNDSAFKEVTIDFFKFYNQSYIEYCNKLILLKAKIDNGTATHADYQEYNQYVSQINNRVQAITARLLEKQTIFIRKYIDEIK